MSRVHSDELLAQTQFSVQKQTNFSYKKYSKLTSCVTRTPTFWAYDRKNNSDFPSTYTEDTLKRSFKIDRERTDLGTDSGSGPIWIGSVPVQWKSVTDLVLIRRSAHRLFYQRRHNTQPQVAQSSDLTLPPPIM